jgi:hypothetical protein
MPKKAQTEPWTWVSVVKHSHGKHTGVYQGEVPEDPSRTVTQSGGWYVKDHHVFREERERILQQGTPSPRHASRNVYMCIECEINTVLNTMHTKLPSLPPGVSRARRTQWE